jgi:type I restriction enzyme S subunit
LASAEFIIFPNTPLLKSSYLKYRLNAADFVNFASHLNEGDRPRVSFDQLGIFKLLLPPLAEQHRIVEKIEELFSDLDDGIASLKKAQQQLKVYRQAVLKWAFEGKLTAQWREEQQQQGKLESAETLLEQIKAERDRRYQAELAQWQSDVEAWEAHGKVGKKPGKPKEAKELPVISKEVVSELPKLPNSWTYTYLAYTGDLGRGKSKHRPIAVFARMRCGHDAQNYELIDSLLVGVYLIGSGTAIEMIQSFLGELIHLFKLVRSKLLRGFYGGLLKRITSLD